MKQATINVLVIDKGKSDVPKKLSVCLREKMDLQRSIKHFYSSWPLRTRQIGVGLVWAKIIVDGLLGGRSTDAFEM